MGTKYDTPTQSTKKVKRVAPESYIHPIPPQLVNELPYFFKNWKPSAVVYFSPRSFYKKNTNISRLVSHNNKKVYII